MRGSIVDVCNALATLLLLCGGGIDLCSVGSFEAKGDGVADDDEDGEDEAGGFCEPVRFVQCGGLVVNEMWSSLCA